MIAPDGVAIGRARIGGVRDADRALAARLAVTSVLARADLRPSGLPPAAVLVVRRLDVPGQRLPVQPVGRVDPAWERAARAALVDLHRRASRPFDGQVSPGAAAVLFRDEAELLACLALDISLGRAAERWWWQWHGWRWGGLGRDVLGAVLMESASAAPAALALLAARGEVSAVLRALTGAETGSVLHGVCRAFDVMPPDLDTASALVEPPGRREDGVPSVGQSPPASAPWAPWLPRDVSAASLPQENVCLLGMALALAYAPARARSPEFMRATERWWRGQQVAGRRGVAAAFDLAMPATDEGPAAQTMTPDQATSSEARGDAAFVADPSQATAGGGMSPAPRAAQTAPHGVSSRPADEASPAGESPAIMDGAIATASDRDPATTVAPAPAAQQPPVSSWLDGVRTELGGVLFLINVMRRLDLPGCFEPDWRLASDVGPWGVLELLGRALLQDAARLPTFGKVGNLANLAADPLWAALAALAGRQDGEPAGADFAGPDTVQIPAAWARWLDAGSAPGQRIDLASVSPWDGPLLAGVSRDLRRWLAAVVPHVEQILHNTLGDGIDLAADLLLRRGQLYATSSHVDLVLPLHRVPMAVRRAGLDIDPGWLPDFGRVVQFHYQ